MLRLRSAEDTLAARDRIEQALEREVGRAIRETLGNLLMDARASARSETLVAAAGDGYPPLGTVYGWWTTAVDRRVLSAVREAFRAIWHEVTDGRITQTSLDAAEEYVARVRDRLVRGLEPSLPDDAFNAVRTAVAAAVAEGWSRKRLTDRLGAVLSWERDGDYWRAQIAAADERIDSILDPLGEPGTPAREQARLSDPAVRAAQEDRALATRHLDADRSHWQTRASAIARTEATAAANYGTLAALHYEGVTGKEWLANDGTRTREEHREASGQVVPLASPFMVGGVPMQMPGDPSAPPHLTVNCRCTVLGADL